MNIKKRKRWDYQRLVIGFIMVLLLILGKPAAAQPPGSSTLRVNVELATVEVSVKNKKGQPIQGLKNENFELLIDGKRQEIVTFDEVREEETVAVRPTSLKDSDEAGPRGKVVLIVFDDHTISLSQLKVTRDAAEIYVKKHMAPQDSFAVAIYGRELQIVQTFTRDPNLVIAAIRKPAASFGQSQLGVGFTGKEGQLMAKNVLRKLISLSSSLGEIKGRKSILFFTEDFGAMAEEETIQLIETARKAKVSFYTLIATRASASAGLRQPSSRSSNPPARVPKTESWSSMLAQLLQRLLPESTLLSSPLVAWMMPQQAQQGGGPPSNLPQGPTGSGIGDSSGRDDFDRIDKGTASGQIMQALAKDTYGDVVRESSDLTKGLDAINLEISNYYVLGYRPANLKVEDKLLKVEVKTTVKDGKLLFAHGTYVSKSAATPEVSAAEKNLSNLMNDKKASGGFPLELRPVVFYDSPQLARVVVFARIKPESVSDSNRLDFMGAAFEEGGTQAGRFLGSLTRTNFF
jgi:VWFA-related protein